MSAPGFVRLNALEYACHQSERSLYLWKQTWHVAGYKLTFPVWHWAETRHAQTTRYGYATTAEEAAREATTLDGWSVGGEHQKRESDRPSDHA